jgi:hypothetical protein
MTLPPVACKTCEWLQLASIQLLCTEMLLPVLISSHLTMGGEVKL